MELKEREFEEILELSNLEQQIIAAASKAKGAAPETSGFDRQINQELKHSLGNSPNALSDSMPSLHVDDVSRSPYVSIGTDPFDQETGDHPPTEMLPCCDDQDNWPIEHAQIAMVTSVDNNGKPFKWPEADAYKDDADCDIEGDELMDAEIEKIEGSIPPYKAKKTQPDDSHETDNYSSLVASNNGNTPELDESPEDEEPQSSQTGDQNLSQDSPVESGCPTDPPTNPQSLPQPELVDPKTPSDMSGLCDGTTLPDESSQGTEPTKDESPRVELHREYVSSSTEDTASISRAVWLIGGTILLVLLSLIVKNLSSRTALKKLETQTSLFNSVFIEGPNQCTELFSTSSKPQLTRSCWEKNSTHTYTICARKKPTHVCKYYQSLDSGHTETPTVILNTTDSLTECVAEHVHVTSMCDLSEDPALLVNHTETQVNTTDSSMKSTAQYTNPACHLNEDPAFNITTQCLSEHMDRRVHNGLDQSYFVIAESEKLPFLGDWISGPLSDDPGTMLLQPLTPESTNRKKRREEERQNGGKQIEGDGKPQTRPSFVTGILDIVQFILPNSLVGLLSNINPFVSKQGYAVVVLILCCCPQPALTHSNSDDQVPEPINFHTLVVLLVMAFALLVILALIWRRFKSPAPPSVPDQSSDTESSSLESQSNEHQDCTEEMASSERIDRSPPSDNVVSPGEGPFSESSEDVVFYAGMEILPHSTAGDTTELPVLSTTADEDIKPSQPSAKLSDSAVATATMSVAVGEDTDTGSENTAGSEQTDVMEPSATHFHEQEEHFEETSTTSLPLLGSESDTLDTLPVQPASNEPESDSQVANTEESRYPVMESDEAYMDEPQAVDTQEPKHPVMESAGAHMKEHKRPDLKSPLEGPSTINEQSTPTPSFSSQLLSPFEGSGGENSISAPSAKSFTLCSPHQPYKGERMTGPLVADNVRLENKDMLDQPPKSSEDERTQVADNPRFPIVEPIDGTSSSKAQPPETTLLVTTPPVELVIAEKHINPPSSIDESEQGICSDSNQAASDGSMDSLPSSQEDSSKVIEGDCVNTAKLINIPRSVVDKQSGGDSQQENSNGIPSSPKQRLAPKSDADKADTVLQSSKKADSSKAQSSEDHLQYCMDNTNITPSSHSSCEEHSARHPMSSEEKLPPEDNLPKPHTNYSTLACGTGNSAAPLSNQDQSNSASVTSAEHTQGPPPCLVSHEVPESHCIQEDTGKTELTIGGTSRLSVVWNADSSGDTIDNALSATAEQVNGHPLPVDTGTARYTADQPATSNSPEQNHTSFDPCHFDPGLPRLLDNTTSVGEDAPSTQPVASQLLPDAPNEHTSSEHVQELEADTGGHSEESQSVSTGTSSKCSSGSHSELESIQPAESNNIFSPGVDDSRDQPEVLSFGVHSQESEDSSSEYELNGSHHFQVQFQPTLSSSGSDSQEYQPNVDSHMPYGSLIQQDTDTNPLDTGPFGAQNTVPKPLVSHSAPQSKPDYASAGGNIPNIPVCSLQPSISEGREETECDNNTKLLVRRRSYSNQLQLRNEADDGSAGDPTQGVSAQNGGLDNGTGAVQILDGASPSVDTHVGHAMNAVVCEETNHPVNDQLILTVQQYEWTLHCPQVVLHAPPGHAQFNQNGVGHAHINGAANGHAQFAQNVQNEPVVIGVSHDLDDGSFTHSFNTLTEHQQVSVIEPLGMFPMPFPGPHIPLPVPHVPFPVPVQEVHVHEPEPMVDTDTVMAEYDVDTVFHGLRPQYSRWYRDCVRR